MVFAILHENPVIKSIYCLETRIKSVKQIVKEMIP